MFSRIQNFLFVIVLMSGSCHLDRASNVKISVECQIFVIVIFFNFGQVLQFGAHLRHYKSKLNQKRSFLVICKGLSVDEDYDYL